MTCTLTHITGSYSLYMDDFVDDEKYMPKKRTLKYREMPRYPWDRKESMKNSTRRKKSAIARKRQVSKKRENLTVIPKYLTSSANREGKSIDEIPKECFKCGNLHITTEGYLKIDGELKCLCGDCMISFTCHSCLAYCGKTICDSCEDIITDRLEKLYEYD